MRMSDKIYTQYDLDKAVEEAYAEGADSARDGIAEECEEAYENGLEDARKELLISNEAGTQNGIMPLRGENLTDCALFILAKRGNKNPCMGEIVAVEAKLQEAGL